MKTHLLHRANPLSWSLMPEVCGRIAKMADEIGSDFPGVVLGSALQQHFASERPQVAAIAGLTEAGVIGHALIETAQWGGKLVCNVRQLKLDETVPLEDLDAAFGVIQGWARQNGCDELRAFALTEPLARLFRIRYAFETKGVVVGRSVEESPSAPKTETGRSAESRRINQNAAAHLSPS
jgi:hypothetical protein